MKAQTNNSIEQIPAIPPLGVFDISLDIHYAKSHKLPSFSEFHGESGFAEVCVAWNEDGVTVQVDVDKPFEESFFPEYASGDSIELFFDTRGIKMTSVVTRFCHHFVILPQSESEILAREVTRFRGEESHAYCNPEEILVKSMFKKKSYRLTVEFSKDAFFGYDPETFNRIGFSYRINRPEKSPQHFNIKSSFYALEFHPELWASLNLIK